MAEHGERRKIWQPTTRAVKFEAPSTEDNTSKLRNQNLNMVDPEDTLSGTNTTTQNENSTKSGNSQSDT